MAYQLRHRDPLLETHIQEALQRRGKELLGFVLIAAALLLTMMLGTYAPDDPIWLSSSSADAENYLGKLGASLAGPMFVTIGWASWGFALFAFVWGLRFVFHRNEGNFVTRLVFAPIAVALGAVFASAHVPVDGWLHSFGLGGLFGDTVLGALLNLLPISTNLGLKVLTLGFGAAMLTLGLHVLGVDRQELRRFGLFLIIGIVMSYASCIALIGRSASRRAATRANRNASNPDPAPQYHDDEPINLLDHGPEQPQWAEPAVRRAPILSATRTIGATAQPTPVAAEPDPIRTRITDVIRSRAARLKANKTSIVMQPQTDTHNHLPIDDGEVVQNLFAADVPVEQASTVSPRLSNESRTLVLPKAPRPQPSKRALDEAQPGFKFDDKKHAFETPPLSLLTSPTEITRHHLSDEALEENARMLESVLDDYGVRGDIVSVRPGPVVTMYELEPAPGLKASRVIGLADDIARSMSALSARVSTVPGRSVIGIELPNVERENVVLREILAAKDYGDSQIKLPLALGKDIGGEPIVANLAKMPHLLIAGTTGSGKSVAINTMILSLLYKLSPDQCRLIMIDPKMLELSVYDGIPHLLSPVVTDPKKAVVALKWVVGEMEDRYRKMSKMGVRNIDGYNGRVQDALSKNELFKRTVQTGFDDETGEPVFETEEFAPKLLPYIVVVVDEMADLMMVAGKEIEACIQRLAQMARASGIHLIMATQRPSVDVITGTIKANFPTRISFQVTSKIDSRTILGEQGAEQLLGMGDMLYMAGGGKITRIHAPFVSDEEVEEIVNHQKAFGPPVYVHDVLDGPGEDKESSIDLVLGLGGNTNGEDAVYDQAVAIVAKDRKCSTSYIQRKMAIGYNKAARLVERMEDEGLVSSANHVGKRSVLIPEQ